jgi:hypothetical protein
MKKLGLLGKVKVVPELITGLNRENLGTLLIMTKLGTVLMVVSGHIECLNFNIILIGWYNVVLGILWLKNHNLVIDWKTGGL